MLKEQNGAALIVVLITIAIIGVMIPSIMSNITTSAKQFERSEEYTQVNALIDMGVEFTHSVIEGSRDTAKENTESWLEQGNVDSDSIVTYFREQLNSAMRTKGLEDSVRIDVGEENGFKTEIRSISVEGQSIEVDFVVTPVLENEVLDDEEETGTKTIELEFN